jgi:hypothetical protein
MDKNGLGCMVFAAAVIALTVLISVMENRQQAVRDAEAARSRAVATWMDELRKREGNHKEAVEHLREIALESKTTVVERDAAVAGLAGCLTDVKLARAAAEQLGVVASGRGLHGKSWMEEVQAHLRESKEAMSGLNAASCSEDMLVQRGIATFLERPPVKNIKFHIVRDGKSPKEELLASITSDLKHRQFQVIGDDENADIDLRITDAASWAPCVQFWDVKHSCVIWLGSYDPKERRVSGDCWFGKGSSGVFCIAEDGARPAFGEPRARVYIDGLDFRDKIICDWVGLVFNARCDVTRRKEDADATLAHERSVTLIGHYHVVGHPETQIKPAFRITVVISVFARAVSKPVFHREITHEDTDVAADAEERTQKDCDDCAHEVAAALEGAIR